MNSRPRPKRPPTAFPPAHRAAREEMIARHAARMAELFGELEHSRESKSLYVNGVYFHTQDEAAAATGIKRYKIPRLCNGKISIEGVKAVWA